MIKLLFFAVWLQNPLTAYLSLGWGGHSPCDQAALSSASLGRLSCLFFPRQIDVRHRWLTHHLKAVFWIDFTRRPFSLNRWNSNLCPQTASASGVCRADLELVCDPAVRETVSYLLSSLSGLNRQHICEMYLMCVRTGTNDDPEGDRTANPLSCKSGGGRGGGGG